MSMLFDNWITGRMMEARRYSILKYNRILTENEMLHNQWVDDTRFNLGLNITKPQL